MTYWSDYEVNRLIELYGEGEKSATIAEMLGRSVSGIESKIKQLQDAGEIKRKHKKSKKKSPVTSGNATEQEQKKVEVPSANDYTTEPEKSQTRWRVTYTCTACGWSIDRAFDMPYCPHCGVQMDGEEAEHEANII